jgi:hypothetical protein
MKKLMLSVFAATALGAGLPAIAQDGGAECQAGSAWGPKAGCSEGRNPPQYPQYQYGEGPWRGHPQQQPYGYDNRVYPQQPYAYGNQYGNRAYPQTPQVRPAYPYTPYETTRRDRDGDGVRNNRDRFPDDPRRN